MLYGTMMVSMVSIHVLLYNLKITIQYDLGLICWGIVIHGFIDGYLQLITALQASNNNMGQTVLDLFMHAVAVYGVPSCLRGDHGVENIQIAAWIENFRGTQHGLYIWGR